MYPAPPRHCRHWPFWVGILMLGFVRGLSLLLNLAAVGILVEGAESNFKITTRADLERFEFELARRA